MGDIYKWTFDSDATRLAYKLERYISQIRTISLIHCLFNYCNQISEFTKERLKASISKGCYKPSLPKALMRSFGMEYLAYGIILILQELVVK